MTTVLILTHIITAICAFALGVVLPIWVAPNRKSKRRRRK